MENKGDQWKLQVIEDFARWLARVPDHLVDLDEAQAGHEETSGGVDQHAFYSELAALRQEIRLQNREQARRSRELQKAGEACNASIELLKSRSEELAAFEERIRWKAELRCLLPFLEIRDALERGRNAAAAVARADGWWRRPGVGIEGIVQGYELALERFDRALNLLGVQRIPTVGHRFDPHTMTAVEARCLPEAEAGAVIEEFLSGFVREGEVIRAAEVVVNRSPAAEENPESPQEEQESPKETFQGHLAAQLKINSSVNGGNSFR